jgi:hypothetical protein
MSGELASLTLGVLTKWKGVPPAAGVDWLRADLPDARARLAGALFEWQGGIAGPEGVLIWMADDLVELVEIPHPRLDPEVIDALGTPELELESAWSRAGRQRAWPTKGLSVHMTYSAIIRIVAFAAMPVAAFGEHRFATAGSAPRR